MGKNNKNKIFIMAIIIIAISFVLTGVLSITSLKKQIDANASVVNGAILSTICDSLNSEIASSVKDNNLEGTMAELGISEEQLKDFVSEYEAKYDIKLSFLSKEEYQNFKEPRSGYFTSAYIENFGIYILLEDDGKVEKKIINSTLIKSITMYLLFWVLVTGALYYLILHEKKAIKKEESLFAESTTDGLTGMLNRKAYGQALDEIKSKPLDSELAVIVMDVNGLKSVNDNIGHTAGDELITGASICIESAFGRIGKCYRVGGDEFTAIVNGSKQEIENTKLLFQKKVEAWQGKTIKSLAISVGVAYSKEHPDLSFDELVKIADQGMYEDKRLYYERTGKDRRQR